MKVQITVDDYNDFDHAVKLAKEAIAQRGDSTSGEIVHLEPKVDALPGGNSAEFDGETFTEIELGTWRIE